MSPLETLPVPRGMSFAPVPGPLLPPGPPACCHARPCVRQHTRLTVPGLAFRPRTIPTHLMRAATPHRANHLVAKEVADKLLRVLQGTLIARHAQRLELGRRIVLHMADGE